MSQKRSNIFLDVCAIDFWQSVEKYVSDEFRRAYDSLLILTKWFASSADMASRQPTNHLVIATARVHKHKMFL